MKSAKSSKGKNPFNKGKQNNQSMKNFKNTPVKNLNGKHQ